MDHAVKQLKYIIGGGIVAFYLDIPTMIATMLQKPGWPRCVSPNTLLLHLG